MALYADVKGTKHSAFFLIKYLFIYSLWNAKILCVKEQFFFNFYSKGSETKMFENP